MLTSGHAKSPHTHTLLKLIPLSGWCWSAPEKAPCQRKTNLITFLLLLLLVLCCSMPRVFQCATVCLTFALPMYVDWTGRPTKRDGGHVTSSFTSCLLTHPLWSHDGAQIDFPQFSNLSDRFRSCLLLFFCSRRMSVCNWAFCLGRRSAFMCTIDSSNSDAKAAYANRRNRELPTSMDRARNQQAGTQLFKTNRIQRRWRRYLYKQPQWLFSSSARYQFFPAARRQCV